MIVVSVCVPSDALSQPLPSYLGFSFLGHGVSFHSCSSKVQLLLLTFEVGKLLSAAPALSVVDVKCLPQDVQYYSGISQCLFRKTRTGQPVFDNT